MQRPSLSLVLRAAIAAMLVASCGAPAAPAAAPETEPAAAAEARPPTPAPAPATPAEAPRRVSDDPAIQAIFELGTTEPRVGEHLAVLVKEIGPRLTGSHNLMRAEVWARDTLASYGLDARLEAWGEIPVGFDRGPASGRMVAPEEMALDFTTPAWTPGAFGPVRGHAVAYPTTLRAARALAGRAEGAWVVHTAASDKVRGKRAERIDAVLAKAAIAGHVHRARGDDGLVHTFGDHRVDWGDLPDEVHAIVRGDQFDVVAEHLEGGSEVELEFSIDNRFFRGPVPQHNVVADLVGSEKPDEIVIVGGHLDSWDGARGAVDNATGVATTIEAARLLTRAGIRPKRTIRFVLWGGEEQGLLGSRAHVEANRDAMDRVSVVLVHDGGTNFLSGLHVTPEMAEQMEQVFSPVFDLAEDMPFGLYYAPSLRPGGSDHTPYIRAGVPAFFWRQSGDADYRRAHHTQHDTLDAVVPEYQRHSAMVVAMAAYGFAELDEQIERTDAAPIGEPRRLGVFLEGTKITRMTDESKAKAAGMRIGDVIVEIGDTPVTKTRQLVVALQKAPPKVEVAYTRGDARRSVTLDYSDDESEKARAARKARRAKRFGKVPYGELFAGREAPEEKDHDEDGEGSKESKD